MTEIFCGMTVSNLVPLGDKGWLPWENGLDESRFESSQKQ